jgi:hypothetical protein
LSREPRMSESRRPALAPAFALALGFAVACAPATKPAGPGAPPERRLTEAELNATEPFSGPMPIEPDKTSTEPGALLDGRSFPAPHPLESPLPAAKRTRFVAGAAPSGGDGSEGKPWNDLHVALRALAPGDRLVVKAGVFPGRFRVDERCRDGTRDAPIEVLFEGAILQPTTAEAALSIGRAHWLFEGLWIVLGNAGAPAVFVGGAHDVRITNAQIYQGVGTGIVIGPGSAAVTVAGAHVHNLGLLYRDRPSFAIDIQAGTRNVTVVTSKLHHNSGGSIRIGSGDGAAPEGISVAGNRIHNDRRPAVLIQRGRHVRITDNQIYNYRPVNGAWGQAVFVEGGEDLFVEGNHISESTVGVQIGRGDPSGKTRPEGPRGVTIQRNYLENRLTGDASAVVAELGRDVRIWNNVIDQYASGILFFGAAPGAGGWVAANNLLLGLSDTAFLIADLKALAFFDANGFSPQTAAVTVQVGGETLPLTRFLQRGTMPKSILASGVALEGRDLGKVRGLPTVDRGQAFDGLAFQGSAPDLGVAEH